MKCSVIIHLGRRSENTTSRTYLMMNCIKNHFNPKEYLHGTSAPARGMEIHLYLMVNTDGVSIFCSSNFSLWPVNFVITGLPPEKRCQIYIYIFNAFNWTVYNSRGPEGKRLEWNILCQSQSQVTTALPTKHWLTKKRIRCI